MMFETRRRNRGSEIAIIADGHGRSEKMVELRRVRDLQGELVNQR
jgi:hypothetical protein